MQVNPEGLHLLGIAATCKMSGPFGAAKSISSLPWVSPTAIHVLPLRGKLHSPDSNTATPSAAQK